MLEKLETHTKNESFIARMQKLAADPKFAAAAGGYVEEMAEELAAEGTGGAAELSGPLDEEDDELDEEEDEEEELDEDDDESGEEKEE